MANSEQRKTNYMLCHQNVYKIIGIFLHLVIPGNKKSRNELGYEIFIHFLSMITPLTKLMRKNFIKAIRNFLVDCIFDIVKLQENYVSKEHFKGIKLNYHVVKLGTENLPRDSISYPNNSSIMPADKECIFTTLFNLQNQPQP